jgi:hypothetical protein
MLMLNPRYRGATAGDLGSGSIWGDLPANIDDPRVGWHDFTDFNEIPPHSSSSGGSVTANEGRWSVYLDQGGFIRNPVTADENVGLEIGSDGDNEIANMITRGKMFVASAARPAWFEAELAVSTIADTTFGVFCGITEWAVSATDVLLNDSGALADRNLLGFHRLEADGDKLDIVYKADGQTAQTLLADAATLVAATNIRIGFKLIPTNPTTKRVVFYVNGAPLTTYLTTTLMDAATFPDDVNMGFGLCVANAAGSSPGSAAFRWMRAAQLA